MQRAALTSAPCCVFLLVLALLGSLGLVLASAETTSTDASAEAIMPAIVIGVAGGTGAGKTTLARAVYEALGSDSNVAYLCHDSYYKDITHLTFDERAKTNFDHPDSLDTDLLIEHVQQLKVGGAVAVPTYDFTKHARTSEVTMVEPKKVVLVEGILIFSDKRLVDQLDVKVFVEADSDIRLMRRISRDTVERGRSVDEVMSQYLSTVRPMHEEFVEPSKRRADVIVHSLDGNSTSVALQMIVNHVKNEAGLEDTTGSDKSSVDHKDEL